MIIRVAAACSRSAFLVAFFVALASSGCASPTSTSVPVGPTTSMGPSATGSFVSGNNPDLTISEFSKDAGAPIDLAMTPAADLSTPPGACGSVTAAGVCNADTLTYCSSSNQLVTKDCTATSKTCQVSSSGTASCKAATTGCGSIDARGTCSGNTLQYCDTSTNTLVTQSCSTSGTFCQLDFSYDLYMCE